MADQNTGPYVTKDQTVSGWHVATIIIGIAITLPAFLIGAEIMGALGTQMGAGAILVGGMLLAALASVCMHIAVSKRLTTYQILGASFGSLGSRFVSALISLTLLGWFGVTVSLFGQAAAKSVEELSGLLLPFEYYVLIGCLVMSVTTIYGFRAIDFLSKLSVPLMFIILLAGVYSVSSNYSWREIWQAPQNSDSTINSFGAAVSVVVGSFMVGLTILPDISRFINRKEQVYVASIGSFGTFFSLILIMSGLPGVMTGEKNLITAMYQSGLGIPALIMMVFACWTTNVSNLYSCSLGLAQVLPNAKGWQITVFAGIVGGIMAISGIMAYLIDFLVLLGIFIPPVAGIYISHFFFNIANTQRAVSVPALLSWGLASGVAFSTSTGLYTITTVSALDSLLTSIFCYISLTKAYVLWLRSRPLSDY